jgi:hypothetical protein
VGKYRDISKSVVFGTFTRIPESTHLKTPHSLMGLLKKLEIRDKSRDRFLLNVARF